MTSNSMAILGQVFYEPGKAFDALKDKPRGWLPVLLIAGLMALVTLWYYKTVDFSWLLDHMMAAIPDAKPEARAAMAKMMTPGSSTVIGVLSSLVGIPVIYAIYGLYYLFAAKITGSAIGFKQWYAFSAWVNVPVLLTIPLMALQIATGHGQIGPEDLQMTSLNYLVFHLSPSSHWATMLASANLVSLWTIVLSVIGLRVWTGRGIGTCVTVTLVPWIVVYGLWSAKILVLG